MATKQQILRDVKAWRDDLRTTTKRQGKGELGTAKRGYCCLGLLCLTTGEAFCSDLSHPEKESQPIAHAAWRLVQDELDLFRPDPSWIEGISLVTANDTEDLTFNEIADLVDIALIELETE